MSELASSPAYFSNLLDDAVERYADFCTAYAPLLKREGRWPRSYCEGSFWWIQADDWTSGFVAGCLWLLYEHSNAARELDQARSFTAPLFEQRLNRGTHDVGFMIENSFGRGYRLTGDASYREAVLEAAGSLASRFNQHVGATRSWDFGDWSFPVIIDNMMNLELLCHAAVVGNQPSYQSLAERHALTTLRDHFRSDHSSYHLVDYDPETGRVLRKQTRQGLHDESAWARGQAWGMYGFSSMYRWTGNERFLRQAVAIADFYTQHPTLPDDKVPYFDFAVVEDKSLPRHRDASAAAIAASALLELASFEACRPKAKAYQHFAHRSLQALASPAYLAKPGENGGFLLMHSVGSYPEGHEVDAAINYADYYFIEALLRAVRLA